MKANELRIGNWVLWKGPSHDEYALVSAITKYEIIFKCGDSGLITEIEPIPLTEEWLIKLGLELYDGFSNQRFIRVIKHKYDTSIITFSPNEQLLRFSNGDPKGSTLIPNIKNVHQLQNLYFDLTGEELNYGGNK